MEIQEYLDRSLHLILQAWRLRRRGLEDGVRHANIERELDGLDRTFRDEKR